MAEPASAASPGFIQHDERQRQEQQRQRQEHEGSHDIRIGYCQQAMDDSSEHGDTTKFLRPPEPSNRPTVPGARRPGVSAREEG